MAMGSVELHELYFGNLGGQGNQVPDQVHEATAYIDAFMRGER
jgi:hypothetical protein